MLDRILTVNRLSKKSIFADRHGKILYPREFVVETLAYYDTCEALGIDNTPSLRLKLHRERQKVKNMVKIHFANVEECNARVNSLVNKSLTRARKRGLVAQLLVRVKFARVRGANFVIF